jgi:cyclopropane fatty-acyl-phospholipid synthase-like methyltransferase
VTEIKDYKQALYENYRSTHNVHLYGRISLQLIEQNFSAWKYYFGKILPVDKQAKILEIGCGDGAFIYFLQKQGYANVKGIDVSAEQIALGASLGISNLKVEDALVALSNEEGYDLIIARDVIEHFTRQEAFELLANVNKALVSGGKFMMQVPNGEGIFHTSIYYGDFTHELAFTASSARQLFLNTGFKACSCYPIGPAPHTLKGAIRKFLWSLLVVYHRFWKMVATGSGHGIFTSNLIAVGEKN